nr:MAG TPA: hypothetical protein [Caudoviricetes sp.]
MFRSFNADTLAPPCCFNQPAAIPLRAAAVSIYEPTGRRIA